MMRAKEATSPHGRPSLHADRTGAEQAPRIRCSWILSPRWRGMIRKVRHLVAIDEDASLRIDYEHSQISD